MCDGDIDLETLIYDYKKASDFYRHRMNINYFKNDNKQIFNEHFFDLLDMIFVSNQVNKELPQKVKDIINDIYDEENDSLKIDIALILMMALKVLPTFNEGGDFRSSHENCTDDTKSSIEENFNTTVTFFKLYLQHLGYDYLIPLDLLERATIEAPNGKDEYDKYSAIPVLNRITLYWYITTILGQIDINEHSTKLKVLRKQYEKINYFLAFQVFGAKTNLDFATNIGIFKKLFGATLSISAIRKKRL